MSIHSMWLPKQFEDKLFGDKEIIQKIEFDFICFEDGEPSSFMNCIVRRGLFENKDMIAIVDNNELAISIESFRATNPSITIQCVVYIDNKKIISHVYAAQSNPDIDNWPNGVVIIKFGHKYGLS